MVFKLVLIYMITMIMEAFGIFFKFLIRIGCSFSAVLFFFSWLQCHLCCSQFLCSRLDIKVYVISTTGQTKTQENTKPAKIRGFFWSRKHFS